MRVMVGDRPATHMVAQVSDPHIAKTRDRAAHFQRLPRLRVAQWVMDYLAYGWSVEEMCRQHPYLTPAEAHAEAHAAMGYYFDHQSEIDGEIRREWEQIEAERERWGRSPFYQRLQVTG